MDVQNFLLLQTFTRKEKKLQAIEKRQASLLSFLKREYETLQILNEKPRMTVNEKLMRFRNLRSAYTFKSGDKNDNEQLKNNTLQPSVQKAPKHVHLLNERRNKMISVGNLFSQNNRKSIQESSIKKVSSTMSQLQMKREMLARRNEFGNFCSAKFINKKGSRPSTTNSVVNHQSGNPSVEHQALSNRKKFRHVVDEHKSSFKKINYEDEICRNVHSKDEELINEIKRPSIFETENMNNCEELIYRAFEAIEIGEILKASNEVSAKVSQVSREEMIDYDTIDDAIMEEVKKASTQIECSQSEIDYESNNGLDETVIENKNKDSATASNASMICLNSSMSIDGNLQDESVCYEKKTSEMICYEVNQESYGETSDKSSRAESLENIKNLKQTSPTFSDSENEITLPSDATNNTIIMKMKAALSGMMFKIIDDVTQPTEKLCENKNSSDTACLSKNADDESFSSSHSYASTKILRTTSTFTSKNEIFKRTMEIQKRRIDSDRDDNVGVNESSSATSNRSVSDSSSSMSEIVRRVVNFDD